MSNKTIDQLIKEKLPKDGEFIINISKGKNTMTVNVSSHAESKVKFDAGITINGDLSAASKALELISEIVSESV